MFKRPFTFISNAKPCPKIPVFQPSRNFTYQAPRLAKSLTQKGSKIQTNTKPSSQQHSRKNVTDIRFIGRRSASLAELDRKVAQNGEVLLFKASPQRSYIIGAYGIGAFAFGYAVINSSLDYQDTRSNLAYWQKSLNIVFIARTSRLVRDITALDVKGQTLLRVRVRSMIPFRKPYTITVAPNQVLFNERLVAGSGSVPRARDINISLFKNPLKMINFSLFKTFISIRRVFTQEDFIMMEMQGQKGAYRVGIDGYVSDDLLSITSPTGRR
ncbi:conserved hypothetical protein [Talaromyces stipitatus ATCC 10500]|uniref:Uncharacterized protein n=1 Tax=Talaromyces stipitatus (strain ATCC 10500 / CBS 375.48 / QM 6759 / NRRL 1006) TaxID=441959 RepID=B8MT95_TALSN|nr:uncharacterized protein TSTA_003370 [Talaromyces stipitatus ATCC 10500]EED12278.1 conserved hypothetical protein [Talaromyces stipitatus ATCC 10500]